MIPELGGMIKPLPWAGIGFIIGGLVSMGMPGFSGFVAEFPIFMGAWKTLPLVAIIAILGVIVTAGYILLVIGRVFFGSIPEKLEKMVGDIGVMDKLVVGVLAALIVIIGVFPTLSKMAPMIQSGVAPILALVGGA